MNKSSLSAFLTATLISSLILVSAAVFCTVHASIESIPKPSVPEFTVTFTDHSYDVPPIYGIDQFTGENVTTQEATHYQWDTLDFTIRNQQAPSDYNLYYNIRYKGQYTDDWTELYYGDTYPRQQAGENSTISFLVSDSLPPYGYMDKLPIPEGAKVDFQLEAMIGNIYRKSPGFASGYEFRGETSGWSNTQTITIPNSSPSPTITPTPTTSPTPIPVPGYSAFSVESNSTVTDLFFNSTSSELSFRVNGTTGTTGYVKVTVAKSLVSSIQNVKAYLDGSELAVTITSDENSWFLTFNYSHSTHNVKISLTGNEATAPLLGIEWVGISVAVIVVVVGFCLLFYFKKRNR